MPNNSFNPYVPQGFIDGQILNADQLNYVETGISSNSTALQTAISDIEDIDTTVGANSTNITNIKSKLTKFTDSQSNGNIVITYEDVTTG